MRVLFLILESNAYPRYGIMCLAAALKAQKHDVRLANAGRLGPSGLARCMEEFKPQMVGYSAMSGEHLKCLELNLALKREFTFLSVFGGPHATFAPHELINAPGCDAVCVGEGDVALPEFCRRFDGGEAYWETPNFLVRHREAVVSNPVCALVGDLNSLPMPDHDLMYQAEPDLARDGTKVFFSSRGCCYDCAYCFNHAFNALYSDRGPIVRWRSPENIIAEIEHVAAAYPLDSVFIHDDTFLLKPKEWFGHFGTLYKERVGRPFSCLVRPNLVTDEIIGTLRDAGLRSVWMGVECGDEEVANGLLRRGMSNADILKAAEIIKRHRVLLVTQNLIGLPVQESYQTDLKTLDLNIQMGPEFAWASILYPYPGTRIQAFAVEHGFLPASGVPLLETNKRSSVLTFSSPMEKRRVENLHKLFGLIVRAPWLRRHCDFLCSLPTNPFYRMIYYLMCGIVFKTRLFPFKSFPREVVKFSLLFIRMVRKT
ncbi:MAG TPA: radical SAM protein [Candidatus Hydrogenedentes bacterium]|nr:radical SAM protein [Candidatus Hydrogenedentota bacterium]HOH52359.1 radical SAM protein [Candidatus Hydrogenedentota bacterium]